MAELETRRLGKTELKPKALGLGCAHLGNEQRVSDEGAVEAIRHAIDRGIDFVDTASGYGRGHSQRRVGLALEGGWRDKVILQTKTGSRPEGEPRDFTREGTIKSLENSFKLLKTDYIDSLLIHGPREIEPPLEPGACLDVLLEWKEKGRIGHIGIGVRQHEFHTRAIETGHMDIILSFQDYTLINQSVAGTSIPLARKHDIGIILASVLGMGLLAGPEPDTEREKRSWPDQEPIAHRMWQWCQDQDINIRDLALQFCLKAPVEGNGILLAGPANLQEFNEVFESATADVSEDVWQSFETEFGIRG